MTRNGGMAMAPTSRKRRPRSRAAAGTAEPPGAPPPSLRGEARSEQLRAELEPLAPGERPVPLIVASVVSAVVAVAVLVGATTQHDLSSHGGSLIGGVFLAAVLALLAGGMYNRRYWAVLGFEGLVAFQIIVSCLALTVVSSLVVAIVLLVVVGLAGWLFWKLVRIMGRLQVTEMERRSAAS